MKKDLKKLHDEFIKEMRFASKRSPSTLRAYQDTFNLLLKLKPGLSLSLLTSKTLASFFEELDKRERKNGNTIKSGVTDSTIATYFSKLGAFFAWLERNKHIKTNPLKNIKKPNVKYETRQYLSRKQVLQIFTAINHSIEWPNALLRKRNELVIYICLGCGLRKSEMRNLLLNDLDLEKGMLTVRWETSKSKITREVPISRKLLQRIKDYISERNKSSYKSPYLFVSGLGDIQLSESGLKHVMERIKEGSGINFHLHQLRHTFAVNYLLKNSRDIYGLKQLMGHQDIRMTEKYLRCLPTDELRAGVEDITPENLF